VWVSFVHQIQDLIEPVNLGMVIDASMYINWKMWFSFIECSFGAFHDRNMGDRKDKLVDFANIQY